MKRTMIISLESGDGGLKETKRLPIIKAASIDTSRDMQFLYIEKKPGKSGFTVNWSTNLIPEGMKIKNISIEKED